MLVRLIGEDIDLVTNLNPNLGNVMADAGQIEQVLMNLVVNARDAMVNGGKITIETANVYLDDAYGSHHLSVTPGWYVLLAVSDTGVGMDEAVKARIFEPFFTTKPLGKGTGLGLSVIYGIVKQSGGTIWVYSEPGKGSTFKIYLPMVQDEKAAGVISSAEPIRGGSETILVVEDEALVRELVREVLEAEGYNVIVAARGQEAIDICRQHTDPIDLLITDLVMPEMSGRELTERLTGECRDLKVLYMSGYTDDAVVRHGLLEASNAFLQKPFTPEDLARRVRLALDTV
jgi:CheY-like chemotaxis protein